MDFNAPASELLEGRDATPRFVSVELAGSNQVALFQRNEDGGIDELRRRFEPWLLAADPNPWAHWRGADLSMLTGDNAFHTLVRFPDWRSFQDANRHARDTGLKIQSLASPVEQFLVSSGITLFKGMRFENLIRLQLDIETIGLDPKVEEGRMLMVALRWGAESRIIELQTSEADVIDELSDAIVQIDPDVIEGHNIFNFDLPFIEERARRWSRPLNWGRDGSALRVSNREDRMKVGPQSHSFRGATIYGRHIIDSYQQIQRYDVAGKLTSYGLKQSIQALGLEAPDRPIIPGNEIEAFWKRDRETLHAYALADVQDVARLVELAAPTEFYQTQIIPRSYQRSAASGAGSKINLLMLRAYLTAEASVPESQPSRGYPGGHAELLRTGVFSPIVKCDVESLYPSLMLANRIAPASDTLHAFLPMLDELTIRRRSAKAKARTAHGAEYALWNGLQSSFKVLINSFYGYLGFNRGLFNDYDAAERITLAGQAIVKDVVGTLELLGAVPIEVDTDGVYFVPPDAVRTEAEELAFIADISDRLPTGIQLAHDGRFRAMLSLHVKNYALLNDDDRVSMTGSSLRSRRLEPVFRRFLEEAARLFMTDRPDDVRELYFTIAAEIQSRSLSPKEISQWAMIRNETVQRQPRLARLLARSADTISTGERIMMYEREDGELALTSEYAGDENLTYLLQRLHETAARFEPLYESSSELKMLFPLIGPVTNIDAARTRPLVHQLGLF